MQDDLWFKKCVLYQIYPRSFKDSNGDGIGDLRGIIKKLDYIQGTNDSLGVSAIWISPIYASPMIDFGYDISDYCSIHPIFGTMNDFEDLVKEAHNRDLKIFMDFVPNHTSDQHNWFKESSANLNNPKREWYIWADPSENGGPPNNWLSVFGGSAWEFDKKTGQYYLHTFLKEQPDLNWRNTELRDEMLNVVRFWIKKGVDGFRTDSFPHIFKDPLLRDEPKNPDYKPGEWSWLQLRHIYTANSPEIIKAYKWFNVVFEEFPDRQLYMVTEDFFADVNGLRWHYDNSNPRYFAPLNLHLPRIEWSAESIKSFVDKYEGALGSEDWPNYSLGNHDNPRIAQRYGNKSIRIAAMLMLTLRGLPVLYYGDELGMENVDIPPDKVQDPFELRDPGKGTGRDPERTPMQWDGTEFAGFSNVDPWLPVSKDYKSRNVEKLSDNPKSILSLYKELLGLRNTLDALSIGKYCANDCGNKNVFSFYREHGDEKILILLNFSDIKQHVKINELSLDVLVDTNMAKKGLKVSAGSFEIEKNAGYVMKIN